MFKILTKTNAA